MAYDGTEFAGWQRQRGMRTVQETLEAVIEKVTGRRPSVLASGRTDAGVHALGQVASFETESRLSVEVLRRALNAELPHSVAVLEAVEVPAGFHATHHVVRKRYRYVIHDGPIRDVFSPPILLAFHLWTARCRGHAAGRRGAGGKHDFSSFQTAGPGRPACASFELRIERGRGVSAEPIFELSIHERGRGEGEDFSTLEIEADGFLYNMVRAIVGTLVEVGRGARPEAWPGEVLRAADRRLAGRTAPPQGLFLVRAEVRGNRDDSGLRLSCQDRPGLHRRPTLGRHGKIRPRLPGARTGS